MKRKELYTKELTEYTIGEFVHACANVLGLPVKFALEDTSVFDTNYPEGANFDGTETLRQALDAVAEATQTMYYVDWDWKLTFKRLDKDTDPVLVIDKSKYFTLSSKGDKKLATITHATELSDNVTVTDNTDGVVQYVRNNPFWDLRDDIHTLMNNALVAAAGITINQMNITWRGDWRVELGDRIAAVAKDGSTIFCYLLNDTVSYNGGLKQVTTWSFTEHTAETASNPITIGDALKNTVARVDKLNGEITLAVQETVKVQNKIDEVDSKVQDNYTEVTTKLAEIEITADVITSSVEQNIINTNNKIDGLEQNIDMISSKVSSTMTSEEVELLVQRTYSQGMNSVETTTGFTFNEEGLTVSKSNSSITTTITEDGMTVYKEGEVMLTANNQGVEANNLRSNYIIISNRCRFEKYGDDRAGCYWLSGGEG